MRIIKFSINSSAYETFLNTCKTEEITVKKKLNILVAKYSGIGTNINDYFPENFDQDMRSITLKVNEELYKSFIKNADRFDVRLRRFIPYLIYRFLKEES